MFGAAKDAFTGAAARKFISGRIERYGTVRDLKIDSRQKTAMISCELIGESTPISIEVGRYEVEQGSDGKDYIRATQCRCSRPWITHLLEDFVEGKRFEVPSWARAAL
jgi:hypothetical protein